MILIIFFMLHLFDISAGNRQCGAIQGAIALLPSRPPERAEQMDYG
ncbi:hypothetical protein [Marinobacterium lutimaris]|uniref:Uncharacterized protein n=1 Tax=Marinobacterium lutimaris TaxID=568106 RepID=A0A1H5XTF5_9GAMM|nr:hypothetical protein [Marinobacterium lutimaris]SEG14958.1 hypothetical protein SAMN05444390_1011496 [Marinobacterium lutimaris]